MWRFFLHIFGGRLLKALRSRQIVVLLQNFLNLLPLTWRLVRIIDMLLAVSLEHLWYVICVHRVWEMHLTTFLRTGPYREVLLALFTFRVPIHVVKAYWKWRSWLVKVIPFLALGCHWILLELPLWSVDITAAILANDFFVVSNITGIFLILQALLTTNGALDQWLLIHSWRVLTTLARWKVALFYDGQWIWGVPPILSGHEPAPH